MSWRHVFISSLLLFFPILCAGYRILVVFPEPTRSHGILGEGYVRLLLEAGHEVTYITPFPLNNTDNLLQVDISSNLETSSEIFHNLVEGYKDHSKFLLMLSLEFGRMAVTHQNVRRFLQDTPQNKFDVVIAEWIDSELYSGFAAFFNCPLIWSVSTQLYWQPLRIMDEVPNPAYSVDVNSESMMPLSFKNRMTELFTQIEKSWILHFTIYSEENNIYNDVFAKSSLPYEDVPKQYSMMLVNTHPSVATPWRVPPSVKEIAGYHVRETRMGWNLFSILERSPQGVIYFSMGTAISGKDMPEKMREEMLEMFKGLSQTVVWKIDVKLENVPSNVHLMEWVPQTSLLGHKNTKVFITHGGMLSTIETLHYGVPIIAIPRHGDQFANVNAAVKKGFAISLDYNNDLPYNLKIAVENMLEDKNYTWKAKEWSRIYHDRPVPPGKELVHWVEHVVSMRGAEHLRSPALLVPWHQKMYIELVAIITAIVITILSLFIWSMCCCVRKIKKRIKK